MRYFLLCDDEDTLVGMRLAGIKGEIVGSRRELESQIDRVRADSGIAVMLVTEKCAAYNPELITGLKLSLHRPLVVVIPGSRGGARSAGSITGLIREAIGVKI